MWAMLETFLACKKLPKVTQDEAAMSIKFGLYR